jgi:hypothetical protein
MTLGTFANCGPVFWTDTALAQNATLEFEKIKVELGATATPFEVRPVVAELALCQRYFERRTTADQFHTLPGSAGLITTTTRGEIPFVYAEKRGAPSLSTVNAFDLFAATGGFVSSLTFAFISARGCRIRATTTSTTYTEGQACYLRAEGVGGAALDIDAEL